ncbi:MAG: L,D-transpeptidase [Gammaproteobacteria bacterium]|nr:L,D-transpeptidase [Gammaproteobacteria bacterium]
MSKLIHTIFIILCFSIGTAFALDQPEPADQPLVSAYGHGLCKLPSYKCVDVSGKRDWKRLFPDKMKREIAMRLNRTNVSLYYSRTIVVPKSWKNLNYMDLSPFPAHYNTGNKKLLIVDLSLFAFAAYNADGSLEFWGPATGGKSWCEDLGRSCATKAGQFHIYRIQGSECTSSRYPIEENGGAEMPYCMHYFKGFAVHGSTLSGFRHKSRGCVRLFEEDAKWLNEYFVKRGTRILVVH